eukprot:1694693-Alexandrium_andersonii.AAC.1
MALDAPSSFFGGRGRGRGGGTAEGELNWSRMVGVKSLRNKLDRKRKWKVLVDTEIDATTGKQKVDLWAF